MNARDLPDVSIDALLRSLRVSSIKPSTVWQRVLDRARRGEVNSYCEMLAREALMQLMSVRDPGEDEIESEAISSLSQSGEANA